jgi:NitT/TauT family transport system ATP-binding protein
MLRVDRLRKAFGPVEAIADLSFDVGANEIVSVVGPSGCGKSTLLKCMAGLVQPTTGHVSLHGELITSPPPTMAPVFQDYGRSLFPWMTVRRNVAFPLRRLTRDRAAVRASVEAAVASVDLTRFTDHYPWQLSGGMQQRVAIARALAYEPQVLLMDEPFASVDAQTRAGLEDLLLHVHDRYPMTVVIVTHDIDEAVYLSDRILVLTDAPAMLHQTLDVDLPRARDQVASKQHPEFTRLRTLVYRSLKQKRRRDDLGAAGRADLYGPAFRAQRPAASLSTISTTELMKQSGSRSFDDVEHP